MFTIFLMINVYSIRAQETVTNTGSNAAGGHEA